MPCPESGMTKQLLPVHEDAPGWPSLETASTADGSHDSHDDSFGEDSYVDSEDAVEDPMIRMTILSTPPECESLPRPVCRLLEKSKIPAQKAPESGNRIHPSVSCCHVVTAA